MKPIARLITKSEVINELDLSDILESLTKSPLGPRWSVEEATHFCELYRSFLYLSLVYPNEPIVPSPEIDIVWHQHILYTKKYAEDCESIFKRFLHHSPLGLKEGEKEVLNSYYERTMELVRSEFPELL